MSDHNVTTAIQHVELKEMEAGKAPKKDTHDSPRSGVTLDEEERFTRASIYVTNALRGRLSTTDDPKLYAFFHGSTWNTIYFTSVVLLCALVIFENPSTVWKYSIPQDEPLIALPFGE